MASLLLKTDSRSFIFFPLSYLMHGIVVRSTGSWYTVRLDGEERCVECKIKGNFRLKGIRSTNPVAVGDGVTVVAARDNAAFITAIDNRRNYVIRKASNLSKQSHILAANLDQVLLFCTLSMPETSTTFIDRFLAGAEAYRIPVVLLFNKVDLLTPALTSRLDALESLYRGIGYETHRISAIDQGQVMALQPVLGDRRTLLAGHSGTGKSTLLNVLVPEAHARTAEVSETHKTGQHTTTFSELYRLPFGGEIIDIPGIKGFGTFDIEPEEVASYFREIFEVGADCRFANCTHTHEPACAVRQAVADGRIAASRYNSYLSMLQDKEEAKYRPAY